MSETQIMCGILVLHFLTGAIFGPLKIKEYLDLTPFEKLPWHRRLWRRLLFPRIWGKRWPISYPHDNCFFIDPPMYDIYGMCAYETASGNVNYERRTKTIKKYLALSILIGGLCNFIPLVLGLVKSMLIGIEAVFSKIPLASNLIETKDIRQSDDKLDSLRKFRDQNIADQRKRLRDLLNKTQTDIMSIEKLIQSWRAHINALERNKMDIGVERLKSLLKMIEAIPSEKRIDMEKISQAINDLDSKREELDGFIRTLELYQETAALIPELNGAGKSITDQIQENMVAADEAVNFCRRFSEMELEIGARLQLTPETLARGWAEGLEREDKIINEKNSLSE